MEDTESYPYNLLNIKSLGQILQLKCRIRMDKQIQLCTIYKETH